MTLSLLILLAVVGPPPAAVPAPAAPAAEAAPAEPAAAPDLEIVALQTTGPGRIGDCNAVVARLRNAGSAATATPPAVRLEITGEAAWSRTEQTKASIAPGDTVEVWFEQVPLPAGLSRVEAIADPEDRVPESDEGNNRRHVPRDPRLVCGAPDPPPPAGLELLVLVVEASPGAADTPAAVAGRTGAPAAVRASTTPVAGATLEVTSPLRAGVVVASGVTGADGRARLRLTPDRRAPVLRVTASAPGCPPAVRLVTPSPTAGAPNTSPPAGPPAPLELAIELACPGAARRNAAPTGKAGVLEIETALPGRLQIDDEAPATVTFGSRLALQRPAARARLRAWSLDDTLYYDQTADIPPDATRSLVIDAPVLRSTGGDRAVVEDLRSGLQWTVGASTTPGQTAAAAICESLERGGATDWRLPDIDEVAFVLEARARLAEAPGPDGAGVSAATAAATPGGGGLLPGLSDCCVWSSTAHAGGRLTFYLDGGHIYGRNADEGGIGALCVRGAAYTVDPLLVPERYHDRLPGNRRFRPRD